MVFVPVYIRLLWPPVLENRQITWKVHGHRDLLLKTRSWVLRTLHEPNGPVVERFELTPVTLGEEFGMADLVRKFDILEENNWVSLSMIHDDLDEIASASIKIGQYLQVPEQPLSLALHKFHAWRRVKEILTSPSLTQTFSSQLFIGYSHSSGWREDSAFLR